MNRVEDGILEPTPICQFLIWFMGVAMSKSLPSNYDVRRVKYTTSCNHYGVFMEKLKILICLMLFGTARAELSGVALEAYLQAQRAYSQAISSNTPLNLKAEVWLKAVNAAENAVSVAPQEPEPLLLRAQLFTRVQAWSKADTAWKAYFALTEGSTAARALMANVQFELAIQARDQKKLVVAIFYLEQSVTFNPQTQRAWSLLGRSRYEAGRFALAAEACLRALELNPNDQTATYYLKLARAKI
jgi:tetratricopeptide (TPR) repeat protein